MQADISDGPARSTGRRSGTGWFSAASSRICSTLVLSLIVAVVAVVVPSTHDSLSFCDDSSSTKDCEAVSTGFTQTHVNLGWNGGTLTTRSAAGIRSLAGGTALNREMTPTGSSDLMPAECGTEANELDVRQAPAYAEYFRKYVDAYNAQGLKPWMVSLQNEPQNCKTAMPTTLLSPNDPVTLAKGTERAASR